MISKKTTGTLSIFHVPLDSNGYDESGRYYGRSQELWKIILEEPGEGESSDAYEEDLVRASSRKEAKQLFPLAKWYDDDEDHGEDLRNSVSLAELIGEYAFIVVENHFHDQAPSAIFTEYPEAELDTFLLDMDAFKTFLEEKNMFYAPAFDEDKNTLREEVFYLSSSHDTIEEFRNSKRDDLRPEFLKKVEEYVDDLKKITANLNPSTQDLFEKKGPKEFWELVNGVAEFFEEYKYFGYFYEEIYEDKGSDLLVDALTDLLYKIASETNSFEVILDLSVTVDEIDVSINVEKDYWKSKEKLADFLYKPMTLALLEGINENPITPLMVVDPDEFFNKSVERLIFDVLRQANREMHKSFVRLSEYDRNKFLKTWKEKFGKIPVEIEFAHKQPMFGEENYLVEIISYNSLPQLAQLLDAMRPFLPVSLEHLVGPFDWMIKN